MVNMKMPAHKAEAALKAPAPADMPRYPYGLTLQLGDDVLEKLGVDKMPKVGATMMLSARVTVTACRESERQGGGKDRNCELQITDMELGGAPAKKGTAESKMYEE